MAPFGSIGKLFGINTAEAANIGASFATGGIGAGIGSIIGSLGTGSDVMTKGGVLVDGPGTFGRQPMETAPNRPAGVDSPATITNISQTSMVPMQPMQAGFGLAGPALGLLGQGARTLARPGVGGAVGGLATGS
jgi:hypothetical protein